MAKTKTPSNRKTKVGRKDNPNPYTPKKQKSSKWQPPAQTTQPSDTSRRNAQQYKVYSGRSGKSNGTSAHSETTRVRSGATSQRTFTTVSPGRPKIQLPRPIMGPMKSGKRGK